MHLSNYYRKIYKFIYALGYSVRTVQLRYIFMTLYRCLVLKINININSNVEGVQKSNQLQVGLRAQLVEHCTGVAEVMSSNPVYQLELFFQALISQLLSCVYKLVITAMINHGSDVFLLFKYMICCLVNSPAKTI